MLINAEAWQFYTPQGLKVIMDAWLSKNAGSYTK